MEEIDFSKFAQLTAPILKGKMSQAEYARTLLILACDFTGIDDDPVSQRDDEALKSYYTGSRGIGSIAAEISRYTDTQVFERYLENMELRFDAEMALYKALSPYCPTMTDTSIYQSASELLNRIVLRASKGRKGTVSNDTQLNQDKQLEAALIQESNGKCAFCSKRLTTIKRGALITCAEVTRITPVAINSVERLTYEKSGITLPEAGSADDYIALCKDCSSAYLHDSSSGKVKRALKAKDRLKTRQIALDRLDRVPIEDEIAEAIEKLCGVKQGEATALRMDALALCNKISAKEPLLKDRISNDVAKYYRFIEDNFRRLSDTLNLNFDTLIAAQVNMAFESIRTIDDNQSVTYQLLVDWLQEKTGSRSREACEILISFFVQNCEVFDELPK